MSEYLEAHRREYYDSLNAVSRNDAWTEWCIFFLKGLAKQAKENLSRTRKIHELYREMLREVPTLTRSQYSNQTVEFIFNKPTFLQTDFIKAIGVSRQKAYDILQLLKENNILVETKEGKGRRSSLLEFRRLILLAEGKDSSA